MTLLHYTIISISWLHTFTSFTFLTGWRTNCAPWLSGPFPHRLCQPVWLHVMVPCLQSRCSGSSWGKPSNCHKCFLPLYILLLGVEYFILLSSKRYDSPLRPCSASTVPPYYNYVFVPSIRLRTQKQWPALFILEPLMCSTVLSSVDIANVSRTSMGSGARLPELWPQLCHSLAVQVNVTILCLSFFIYKVLLVLIVCMYIFLCNNGIILWCLTVVYIMYVNGYWLIYSIYVWTDR